MHMGTTLRPEPIRRYADGSPPCTWGQRTCGPPGTGCVPVHPHAHGDNGRIFGAGHQVDRFTPMHMGTTQIAKTGNNLRTVHPHAHGDNSTSVVGVEACVGSPPCTWGQPQRIRAQYYYRRFTPMHMGTTAAFAASFAAWPVHPHAHGDNTSGILPAMRTIGSPPCTWGQRGDDSAYLRRPRFTPMHMGTTEQRSCEACRTAVHPHAHGDNNHLAAVLSLQVGSPPCTWGQPPPVAGLAAGGAVHPHAHGDNDRVSARGRTLPVHPHAHGDNERLSEAQRGDGGSPPCTWGQRWPGPRPARRRLVHPHAHGDNLQIVATAGRENGSPPCTWGQLPIRPLTAGSLLGSPPCTWGQPAAGLAAFLGVLVHPHAHGDNVHLVLAQRPADRFTPIHMGTTQETTLANLENKVHPHAHGDNEAVSLQDYQVGRFTPMHMGTTPPFARGRTPRPVHPHAHGDNERLSEAQRGDGGSPPCTWGQLGVHEDAPVPARFTPMHMGTTTFFQRGFHHNGGSPPCTWGQPLRFLCAPLTLRFTPMHMGTTICTMAVSDCASRFTPMHMGTTEGNALVTDSRTVHPHAHGDNWQIRQRTPACRRFTPMHMGTTTVLGVICPASYSVHPHAHGDNGI